MFCYCTLCAFIFGLGGLWAKFFGEGAPCCLSEHGACSIWGTQARTGQQGCWSWRSYLLLWSLGFFLFTLMFPCFQWFPLGPICSSPTHCHWSHPLRSRFPLVLFDGVFNVVHSLLGKSMWGVFPIELVLKSERTTGKTQPQTYCYLLLHVSMFCTGEQEAEANVLWGK